MNTVLVVPKPFVRVDGAELPEEVLRAVTEIRVQQRLSQPTLCELTFDDPDGALARTGVVQPGSSLHVGVSESEDSIFTGEATAVGFSYGPSQEREIRVRAYDLLHRLRKRGEVRAHVQVTAGDLAKEMASDLGLSVKAETPGPLHQILIQQNRTDLDFLLDVAELSGLHITLQDRTLRLCTLQGVDRPVGLELGDTLIEARVEMNGDPACRSVSASGWNPLSAEHYDGRASRPRVGRKTSAAVEPSRLSSPGEVVLSNEAGPDSRFAEAVAQAELDRHVAREVVLRGTAEGDPRLRPAATVSVAGLADVFRGTYVITEAIHRIDAQGGYVTEFSTHPPPSRTRSRGAGATKGVVTRVDDPDKLGRVRVSLPT
ncbi:MAG: phage late control D family protein, partial [bacterium]|nr:phage late control D family protein [bacterium]